MGQTENSPIAKPDMIALSDRLAHLNSSLEEKIEMIMKINDKLRTSPEKSCKDTGQKNYPSSGYIQDIHNGLDVFSMLSDALASEIEKLKLVTGI